MHAFFKRNKACTILYCNKAHMICLLKGKKHIWFFNKNRVHMISLIRIKYKHYFNRIKDKQICLIGIKNSWFLIQIKQSRLFVIYINKSFIFRHKPTQIMFVVLYPRCYNVLQRNTLLYIYYDNVNGCFISKKEMLTKHTRVDALQNNNIHCCRFITLKLINILSVRNKYWC